MTLIPSKQTQFVVPNLAGLAALPFNSNSIALVTDIARGGTFIWDSSNLSMQVTNNPGQGIYVPPSSDTTGASGAWVRQNTTVPGLTGINSGGMVNINTLANPPFVTDGVTTNVPMFQSLATILQGVGTSLPVPVNLTVGTPTVLSINPTTPSDGTLPNPTIHYLKPNQAFYFTLSAGGSIAGLTGISLNTLYYIRAGFQGTDGMTATTFTFSATNNYGAIPPSGGSFTTEGAAVNTTGTFTGTLSIVLTGQDINLFIPPGPYFGGNYGDATANWNVTPNGISRIRYWAYGAEFDTKISFGPNNSSIGRDPRTWATNQFDLVVTTPNDAQAQSVNGLITLQSPQDFIYYFPGLWLSMSGLDLQDSYHLLTSGPANSQYQEFKRITVVNSVAITNITQANPGVVTTGANHGYTTGNLVGIQSVVGMTAVNNLSFTITVLTPTTFSIGVNTTAYGAYASGGVVSNGLITVQGPLRWAYLETFPAMLPTTTGGGQAMITPMHPCWDVELAILGGRYGGEAVETSARTVLFQDMVYQGWGNAPGQTVGAFSMSYTFRNCDFGPGDAAGTAYMEVDKLLNFLEVDDCRGLSGYTLLFPSTSLQTCLINKCQIANLGGTPRNIRLTNSIFNNMKIGSSIGTCDSASVINTTTQWFDMQERFWDATDIFPAADMALMANWSFSGGTFTRNISSLPGSQGMLWWALGAKFYFIDAGNTFKYYQNLGCPFAVMNVTMDNSGNFSFQTTLDSLPTRQTSATVTITNASPGVVTWTGSSLAQDTAICFTNSGAATTFTASLASSGVLTVTAIQGNGVLVVGQSVYDSTGAVSPVFVGAITSQLTGTTGSTGTYQLSPTGTTIASTTMLSTGLPAPLMYSTIYYVARSPAPTTNTFSVAATVGGTAINTTTAGTGTQTAYANPLMFQIHPCPSFTGSQNTGCGSIIDHNGAQDEALFSRVTRNFGGAQGNLSGESSAFQAPNPRIWGQLTSQRFMTVSVTKAASAGTLTITSPGFVTPGASTPSNFSQVIDVTQIGLRTVTNTTTTGSLGSDVLAAYADWLCGPLVFAWSGTPNALLGSPLVSVKIRTDQGVTEFNNMWGAPGAPTTDFLWQYTGGGAIQKYPLGS
jgi:hypothetical protein